MVLSASPVLCWNRSKRIPTFYFLWWNKIRWGYSKWAKDPHTTWVIQWGPLVHCTRTGPVCGRRPNIRNLWGISLYFISLSDRIFKKRPLEITTNGTFDLNWFSLLLFSNCIDAKSIVCGPFSYFEFRFIAAWPLGVRCGCVCFGAAQLYVGFCLSSIELCFVQDSNSGVAFFINNRHVCFICVMISFEMLGCCDSLKPVDITVLNTTRR